MRLAMLVLSVLLAAPAAALADDPTWGGPPGSTPPGAAPAAPAEVIPYAPAPYAPPAKVTREVSYGRQTLISDGIAGLLIATAFTRDDPYSGVLLVVAGRLVSPWSRR